MSTTRPFSALYGGAFNPPHLGHLSAIRHLLALPHIQRVWVVPSLSHAFGKSMPLISMRMEMLELLISELPPSEAERAVLCDVESQLGKPNDTPVYSLEVLDFLTSQNPGESFLLALGPDNCVPNVFHTFYGAARILSDYGVEKIPAQDFERSTLCRTLFKQKTPADVLTSHLPRSIVDYVIQHSLYLEDSL